MTLRKTLEVKIEQVRIDMYEASNKEDNYDEVLQISQKLDELLNELDHIDGKYSTYHVQKDTF